MTHTAALPTPQSRRPAAWLCIAAVLVLTVLLLRLEGRLWWCACRTPTPFSVSVHSSHNSQHLLDPYSFSHLLHGVIFFWVLYLLFPRVQFGWRLLIALVIEAGWEVMENSPLIIARYRAATASLGYSGDTIVNSTGDVLSCALGFFLASSSLPTSTEFRRRSSKTEPGCARNNPSKCSSSLQSSTNASAPRARTVWIRE
jgi:hypothetical protein